MKWHCTNKRRAKGKDNIIYLPAAGEATLAGTANLLSEPILVCWTGNRAVVKLLLLLAKEAVAPGTRRMGWRRYWNFLLLLVKIEDGVIGETTIESRRMTNSSTWRWCLRSGTVGNVIRL